MPKRSLLWNKHIISNEKIIKKQKYLKIFFKNFPKKTNQIIFNSYIKSTYPVPKKSTISRIKDILKNCTKNQIQFLIFSRNISNFELILWIPIFCKIFKIPFFITNSVNLIKKLNKGKNGSIFGVFDNSDKLNKEKQVLINVITKINHEFYLSENLIYY